MLKPDSITYKELVELSASNTSAATLVNILTQCAEHTKKCKKRNVNDCKKCMQNMLSVRFSIEDFELNGRSADYTSCIKASESTFEDRNK